MRTTIPMTIQVPKASLSYACARRAHRVFLSIFLCLCLRIFLRRFLITEPNPTPSACLIYRFEVRRGIIPEGGIHSLPHALHRCPRGASDAPPQVPRERGPAASRGVGGEDLPGRHLPALRGARLSGPPLPT